MGLARGPKKHRPVEDDPEAETENEGSHEDEDENDGKWIRVMKLQIHQKVVQFLIQKKVSDGEVNFLKETVDMY